MAMVYPTLADSLTIYSLTHYLLTGEVATHLVSRRTTNW